MLDLTHSLAIIQPELDLIPSDQQSFFNEKMKTKIFDFLNRMIAAFPNVPLDIRIVSLPAPQTQDVYLPKARWSKKPKLMIDFKVPLRRNDPKYGSRVGGRLIIFDEDNLQDSVYHIIKKELNIN